MAKLKTANPYDESFFAEDRSAVNAPVQVEIEPAPIAPGVGATSAASVRLNIEIDKQLHRQLKRLALDQDRTIADIVRSLIVSVVTESSPVRDA